MAVLLSTPQLVITTDSDAPLVRYVRTAIAYETVMQMDRMHDRMSEILDQAGRRRHFLLVDLRMAQMNQDASFDRSAARGRSMLFRDFQRMAVLVKTAIAALQVARHIREDGKDLPVYQDEATAIAFLRASSGFDVDRTPPPSSRARTAPISRRGPFGK